MVPPTEDSEPAGITDSEDFADDGVPVALGLLAVGETGSPEALTTPGWVWQLAQNIAAITSSSVLGIVVMMVRAVQAAFDPFFITNRVRYSAGTWVVWSELGYPTLYGCFGMSTASHCFVGSFD